MSTKVKIVTSLIVLIIAGFLIMNQNNSTPSNVQGIKQIAETKSPTDINQILEANKTNPEFNLIDIRTPQEYSTGHLEGSTLMDFYNPTFSESLNSLDKNKIYVIYCNSGNRSGSALGLMKAKGFQTVYNMQGGISAWQEASLPISQNSSL